MQVVLVRHALPERVHAADLAGGAPPADPGLTPLGVGQAQRLAVALAGERPTALYASPLRRARETAQPLATVLGREPVLLGDLREYDADSAQYVPVHEMADVDPPGWERMRAGLLPTHVDVDTFADRVSNALEDVVAAHHGRQTAVVVAHAGVINVWLARLLGMARPLTFPLDYAGITRVLAAREGRRVVRTVNETAHVADLLVVS